MADWEPRPPRTATLAEHNIEFAEFMRKNDRVTTLKPEPPTLPPAPTAPTPPKPVRLSDYVYFNIAVTPPDQMDWDTFSWDKEASR